MINVLQIGKGWFPEESGGLNRYFYDCVQHLPNQRNIFQGLVMGSDEVEHRLVMDSGEVEHQYATRLYSFGQSKEPLHKRLGKVRERFIQLQESTRSHVITSHFALHTLPILDLITQPLVTHFHGSWAVERQTEGDSHLIIQSKKQIEKAVYSKTKHFIVLSEAFKKVLEISYGVAEDKISVIPGGVDLNRFQPEFKQREARRQLNWSNDRPIIFAVRRLAKYMGLEQLITAIAYVKRAHPDILLLIAGKGALGDLLQAQIDELGLQDNVQLLGYVDDLDPPVCYQAADFSIVPSQGLEGFGLTLLESLATGTPVLGTPVGGIPEILKPLHQDLVLGSNKVHDLAHGIKDALEGNRYLPSQKECRNYVEENHNWSAIAPQLRDIYKSVI